MPKTRRRCRSPASRFLLLCYWCSLLRADIVGGAVGAGVIVANAVGVGVVVGNAAGVGTIIAGISVASVAAAGTCSGVGLFASPNTIAATAEE